MKKTIGILAHVDAGKTTFSEQLLYHADSIKKRGRVDHHNAYLDSHEIERKRGITVFADQGMLQFHDSVYYIIDNPGHVDFSPEMERSLQVLDYAILIVSAAEGIEGHTETVWELLRKLQIPTFIFINKMDREGADAERVLEEMRSQLSEDICYSTNAFSPADMEETTAEFVAERDEGLLDVYVRQGYDPHIWQTAMIQMIKERKLFPCTSGSALQDTGVLEFMEMFDRLTVTDYSKELPFSSRIYKVKHDAQGARWTYMKILSGSLNVRDTISYGEEGRRVEEKVTQLRFYNGAEYRTAECAEAGDLVAATGLSRSAAGEGAGNLQDRISYDMKPALQSKVSFDSTVHVKEALRCFRILDAEDPSLHVEWSEALQEIHIRVMGAIQLEILEEVVPERFGFHVTFEKPQIIYKETVAAPVRGYGHYEPLKHYAEIHLLIEPQARDSGFSFENRCHHDNLPPGSQNLVRQYMLERDHRGVLTGSALTDVKVTLLTGRGHVKHTSGGDFREASYRALRQGLEKVENILLEPYYQIKIKVELEYLGRVLSDIQQAHGRFEPPVTEGNKAVIAGKVPVATFMNYGSQLASFTRGRGTLQLLFGGYERCHNEKDVIEQISYNRSADPEYTSSSIFCSKGAGYSVPWDEAEEKMHIHKE